MRALPFRNIHKAHSVPKSWSLQLLWKKSSNMIFTWSKNIAIGSCTLIVDDILKSLYLRKNFILQIYLIACHQPEEIKTNKYLLALSKFHKLTNLFIKITNKRLVIKINKISGNCNPGSPLDVINQTSNLFPTWRNALKSSC